MTTLVYAQSDPQTAPSTSSALVGWNRSKHEWFERSVRELQEWGTAMRVPGLYPGPCSPSFGWPIYNVIWYE
jgi:hypothetical protein